MARPAPAWPPGSARGVMVQATSGRETSLAIVRSRSAGGAAPWPRTPTPGDHAGQYTTAPAQKALPAAAARRPPRRHGPFRLDPPQQLVEQLPAVPVGR